MFDEALLDDLFWCSAQHVWNKAATESIFAPQLDIGWPSTSKTRVFDVQLEILGKRWPPGVS
jgi:hypothetical protein